MKKIILFLFLMLNFVAFADVNQYQAPNNNTQTVSIKSLVETNESKLSNVLSTVEFNGSEYIKISGNLSSHGTLSDFKVEQSNISDIKAESIKEKLRLVQNLQIPLGCNKFTLYLYAKPKYLPEKSPFVDLSLYNEEIENYIQNNKKEIRSYWQKNYYNKIHTKLAMLNNKNIDAKPVSVKVKIAKNGTLLTAKIFKSSQNKTYDDEILKIIKSEAPFYGFNLGNLQAVDLMFDFQKKVDIESKIKPNFNNTSQKSFEGGVKVVLNEKGNITESSIAKSTNDKVLDEQMLFAVQKTGNLFETINYDENKPFAKIIVFKNYAQKDNSKPVFGIGYFTPGDDSSASQIELLQYAAIVEYLVKRNWAPPLEKEKYSVTALFIMNKNGQVTSSSIIKSSNKPGADELVLRAIHTAKLPKIPDNFNSDYIPIEMTFDYEMDPNINPILKELYLSK